MTLSESEFLALWSYRTQTYKSDYDIVTSSLTNDERLTILCKRESFAMFGVDWYCLDAKQKTNVVNNVHRKYYENEFIG
jgi:hypothetical protein